MTSFLSLIKRRRSSATGKELDEYVDIAIGYANQMQSIVSDILEFSRIDADIKSTSTSIDVASVVKNVKNQMAPSLLDSKATIEISGEATVLVPLGFVSQLIRNIVENGIKYNDSLFPRIQIVISPVDEQFVSIAISDNGIGIEEDYFDQIFEMFKRLHTRDKYEGTGLGLSVCKKVVERLGGSISIESTLGVGSVFTIVLPVDCTVEVKDKAVASFDED